MSSVILKMLVIGYGNSLRSDDGLGPQIAAAVEAWQRPQVRGLSVHQLVPELAENLARTEAVIFVDAALSRSPDPLAVQLFSPGAVPLPCLGHIYTPELLLALTEQLYGRCPTAWCLQVPAHSLGFGDPEAWTPLRRAGPDDSQPVFFTNGLVSAALQQIEMLISSLEVLGVSPLP